MARAPAKNGWATRRNQSTPAAIARQAKYRSPEHRKARRYWAPLVAEGRVPCWRCQELLLPGEPWHLGHDDDDTSLIRGPEHRACNIKAAAKKGYRAQQAAKRAATFKRAVR